MSNQAPLGFGIPTLVDEVKKLMAVGLPREEAIDQIAISCELRSEAIESLKIAMQTPLENYIGSLGAQEPRG